MSNLHDRVVDMNGAHPLKTSAILELCELYDATLDDFEKTILIEEAIYPIIAKRVREQNDAGSEDPNKRQRSPKGRSRPPTGPKIARR
jgi:hypothetical protein